VAAFDLIDNGFVATDSNNLKLTDTVTINQNLLSTIIPDSVLNMLTLGDRKATFHPIGRIDKTMETYLILLCLKNKKPLTTVLVLDKKNTFLASKDLFDVSDNKDFYKYTININKEPTFFITREKLVNDKEVKFTKTGWAFTGKSFIAIVKESNERNEKQNPILNPIDTFSKQNLYSGNYVQDDRNFISIRDGRTKQDYLFFIHIDKNEGLCTGELKGEMHLTDSTHSLYSLGGDPCVIDFSFDRNIITIKEKGSCGNRRGMDCFFDDAYIKIKEVKKKIVKPENIRIPEVNVTKLLLPTKQKTLTKLSLKSVTNSPLIGVPKIIKPKLPKSVFKTETVIAEKAVTDDKTIPENAKVNPLKAVEKKLIKKPVKTAAKPATSTEENPYSNK